MNGAEWLKSEREIICNLKHNNDHESNGYGMHTQDRSSAVYDATHI